MTLVPTKFLTFGSAEDDRWPLFSSVVQGIATAALAATLTLSALAGQTANLGANEDFTPPPRGVSSNQQAGYPYQIQVRYAWTPDELPQAPRVDEDYWQNAVAPVAGSLYRALPYLPDVEELPAASLFGQPDEDYWQLGPPAVSASLYQPLPYLPDSEEIPAGALSGQYEDDSWANPVSPVSASLVWPQQFTFDQQEPAGSLFGQFDEDFWYQQLSWPIQTVIPLPYSQLGAGIPAAAVVGDEDYWQNQVAPVWAYSPPIVFSDDDVIAPQIATVPGDEDFWQNPVISVPLTLARLDQWTFDQHEPAGSLFGQYDEDFWQNPTAPVPATLGGLYLPDPEEIPAGSLSATVDEYFWQNPTPPVAGALGELYLPDPDEIPASSLSATVDEYFWLNPTPPVPASLLVQLPFLDQDEIPAGSLFGAYDEVFWQNPVAPVPATLYQPLPYLPDPEELPAASLTATVDEYFWASPTAPVAFYAPPLVFSDDEIIVPQPASARDEDFWANPVPVIWALNGALYLPDPEELPAASLSATADEPYWQNPVAPVAGSLLWPQQWSFDSQEPSLFGQFDEDFWQNPVQPVALSFLRLDQWTFEQHEPGALFGQFDEDFWSNPTAPVAAAYLWPQQWAFDVQEPAGALFGQPDEDFWVAPSPWPTTTARAFTDDDVLPVAAVVFTPEEDYYWQGWQVSLIWKPSAFTAWPFMFDDGTFVQFVITPTPPGRGIRLGSSFPAFR